MANQDKKVWGLYTTYDNPELLDELSEIDIWKKIDNLGTKLSQISHSPYSIISREKIIQGRYNLEYLVYLTRKFGVEFDSLPTEVDHVENSESFQAWFSFWKKHFNSMSEEEYNAFVEAKYYGKDISAFMPEKSWKEQAFSK